MSTLYSLLILLLVVSRAFSANDPLTSKEEPVDWAYNILGNPSIPGPQQIPLLTKCIAALSRSRSPDERASAADLNSDFARIIDRRVVVATLRLLLRDSEPAVRREALLSCVGRTGMWEI